MEKTNISKQDLVQTLENILNHIDDAGEDFDWYPQQFSFEREFWEGYRSNDQFLMEEAFKHPDLHPLMKEVVEAITEKNAEGRAIWDEDEEHAGTNAALLFALAHREDVILYANFIATNDLNHPVYQDEDFDAILEHWGICEENLYLMLVIFLCPGQYFESANRWGSFVGWIKEGHINVFFKQLHHLVEFMNAHDLPCRDVQKFLEEYLPQLLPHESEEAVNILISSFMHYVDEDVPTLEILRRNQQIKYRYLYKALLHLLENDAIWDAMDGYEAQGDITLVADFEAGELAFFDHAQEGKFNMNTEFYRFDAKPVMTEFFEALSSLAHKNEVDQDSELHHLFQDLIAGNSFAFANISGSVYGSLDYEASPWDAFFVNHEQDSDDNGVPDVPQPIYKEADFVADILQAYQQKELDAEEEAFFHKINPEKAHAVLYSGNMTLNFGDDKIMTITEAQTMFTGTGTLLIKPLSKAFFNYVRPILGWEIQEAVTLPEHIEVKSGENKALVLYLLELLHQHLPPEDSECYAILEKLIKRKNDFTVYNLLFIPGGRIMLTIGKEDKQHKSGWESYNLSNAYEDQFQIYVEASLVGTLALPEEVGTLLKALPQMQS